ncbi:hypothetical protein PLICRDRAFT_137336 [Plicaturopsis crispa FD-325 SS-3]|nr:hypothetical protein PLICRDRAFT_137336 [Plicaturopsis crispa FD-325 SS-3]
MATAKLRAELVNSFGEQFGSDDALCTECINICQNFNISPEDLLYKWEAFSFSATRTGPVIFNLDQALALKRQIQRDMAAETKKAQQAAQARPHLANFGRGRGSRPSGLERMAFGKASPTPASTRSSNLAGDDRPRTNFAGPSKVAYNGPKQDEASRKKRNYRYMYEKVSERSEALDDRIDEFSELIREHYNIPELGDPSASTEEEITVVGRITLDSDSSSGSVKLNEASLTLEASRMMGSGARVPLRFDSQVRVRGAPRGAGGVGLFPGAIVALKGKNGGGGSFAVSEILSLPPLKPSTGSGMKPDPGDTSFSLVIASGPFTLDTDLKYKPWHTLLDNIKSTKPAAILLIGPFTDVAHPRFKNGDIDNTPTDIFRSQFLDSLRTFLDGAPGSIVLLVPSVRDIISQHAVFPQAEFGPEFAMDPRIRLLPNPCRFSLNDVTFAVNSADVLFHLRKEEFFKRAEEIDSVPAPPSSEDSGGDAMAKLCRHILQQRSFYPIFPVPVDLAHDVNLDITHAADRLKLDVDALDDSAPDVLIVPSRLKHFSKVLDSTIAINPSFLTKAAYATLQYAGSGAGTAHERTKVEIKRLEI